MDLGMKTTVPHTGNQNSICMEIIISYRASSWPKVELGCPRLPDFLQAGYYEVYAQYIKKLEARLDKLKSFFTW